MTLPRLSATNKHAARSSQAAPTQSARLPPVPLDGLDERFSRLVDVPREAESGAGRDRVSTWHILDNGDRLAELGVKPAGTILCVHGNPTWSYLWRRLVSAATEMAATGAQSPAGTQAWRVIAVDQLEMGFSERTGRTRTLADRVLDLSALTNELQLAGPVVTFGHDWGGVVSLGWALAHPELLAGVMLLNTAVHQAADTAIPAPLRLALNPALLKASTVTSPAFLETTLALAHPPLTRAVKDGYRAPYRSAARRGGIGGFVADIPVGPEHESHAALEKIAAGLRELTVPSLLLWGPSDPIFGDRYLDDLIDRMPHADVHRFEGAGHLIAEDVDYAQAALGWLALRVQPGSDPAEVAAPGQTISETSAEYRPLWHFLDELEDSVETALIEMRPATGARPLQVSWQLLSRRVREIAAGLVRIGVRPGDRVSLLVPPGADLTAVLYACVRVGAIVVVADAGLGLKGLSRAVRGAQADFVIGRLPGLTAARALGWPGRAISTARLPAAVARTLGVSWSLGELARLGRNTPLPPEPGPTQAAALLFTSGSTGPAKGVVYTHGQLAAVARALSRQYGVGPGTGLVAGFAPFALLGPALGATSVTPDMDVTAPATLTATAVADAVRVARASVVFLSPAALVNVDATKAALTDSDREALAGVRTFLSAGAPVSEHLLARAAALMPNAQAHTPYGMTEGLLLTDIDLDEIRQTVPVVGTPSGVCVGRPAAGSRVLISALDEVGDAVGSPSDTPDVTGEIVVSAPHIKDHYDRLYLTDRQALRGTGVTGADGARRWHRTGDVGHLDDVGRLWVEGRMVHLIRTPAGVITPVGPELQSERVSRVARAAAVGVGPAGTQQLVIVVETSPASRRVRLAEHTLAAEVRAAVDAPVAAVMVVPRLPTDIRHNSKIDRAGLADWATGILSGGRMGKP